MRTFAIINNHDNVDISQNIISKLSSDDNLVVFQAKETNFDTHSNTEVVKIPEDILDSGSKIKNFVSNYFFANDYKGFLHIIEDNVEILKDPKDFLREIEIMMDKLNLKTWFNTTTDVMNYTFKVYNPRFSVDIDEPSLNNVYPKKIYWTSHANTSWICYDCSKATFDDVKFDESFTIPMYYIIKFLAERRNTKKPGELYYMNFYPTIDEEVGVFKNINVEEKYEATENTFKKEGIIFESMKINHQADMIIETVMDDMFEMLSKKK